MGWIVCGLRREQQANGRSFNDKISFDVWVMIFSNCLTSNIYWVENTSDDGL